MRIRLLGNRAPSLGGVCLLLLPVVAVGCGGGRGTISGKVTFNGKPLPVGTISFYPQSGKQDAINCPIRNGAYSQEGVPTGEVKVGVVTVDPANAGGGSGAAAAGGGGGSDTGARVTATPAGRKKSATFVAVPPRYGSPDTSDLSLTVQTGEQVFDVELTP